jgi:hypothetical protein
VIEEQWIEWSPPWAPHVKGRYTSKVRGDEGFCEPQRVTMVCTHRENGQLCGATWQTVCASGNVRGHINNFAKVHAHKDFAKAPRIVRPNSKRSSVEGVR